MNQQENTPKFIKQVPWYAQNQAKTAIPQVPGSDSNSVRRQLNQWYDRGKQGFKATTFRKGACANCGAMGHNIKECTQRPRKLAAKFTQRNIAADDIIKNVELNWDGKRDRWNGYDPQMYKEVIEQQEQYENLRKRKRMEQGGQKHDKEFRESIDPEELSNLPTKHVKNQKFQGLTGVRNREDRAKYLINLDVNSDYFDPKSRSMKSYDNVAEQLENLEAEDERQDLIGQDRFAAQQVQLNNSELNTSALPTLTEKIYRKVKQGKEKSGAGLKNNDLTKKYGEINTQKPLMVVEQEEEWFDYAKMFKDSRKVKSKYEEDVYINDHLSVWGSWYSKLLGWGYSCCHSTDKHSYCSGSKGKQKALGAELKIKAQNLREAQGQLPTKDSSQSNKQENEK